MHWHIKYKKGRVRGTTAQYEMLKIEPLELWKTCTVSRYGWGHSEYASLGLGPQHSKLIHLLFG